MSNKQKQQKGITLIALVITIIVLLILAGISISMLMGQNGILNRAQEAKEKTEKAGEDELRRLTQMQAAMNLENTTHTDNSTGVEKTVTIPAQCAVSQVEGENTLEDGLVIIDVNGNEWVWIEVPENVTQNATTDDDIKNALISYATEYRTSGYSDEWYEGCGLSEQEYVDKYSEMLRSIKVNNGFFVGRYEVGSFDAPTTANDTTRKAVIQKGAYPYNYVKCSQAQALSEDFRPNEGTTCSLMFGIQWDLILKYLEENGDWDTTTNESSYYLKNDSSSWGNYINAKFPIEEGNMYAVYSNFKLGDWDNVPNNYIKPSYSTRGNGILLSTGSTERNSQMNIYDFAGNVYEWTLEKSTDTGRLCVLRGGYYCNDYGSDVPASDSVNEMTSYSDHHYGFRVTLW